MSCFLFQILGNQITTSDIRTSQSLSLFAKGQVYVNVYSCHGGCIWHIIQCILLWPSYISTTPRIMRKVLNIIFNPHITVLAFHKVNIAAELCFSGKKIRLTDRELHLPPIVKTVCLLRTKSCALSTLTSPISEQIMFHLLGFYLSILFYMWVNPILLFIL